MTWVPFACATGAAACMAALALLIRRDDGRGGRR